MTTRLTPGDSTSKDAGNHELNLDGGTITKLKQQVKRPDRVSIFVDDHFAIGVSSSVLVAAGLRKGELLTAEQLKELHRSDQRGTARVKALNFLSFRARTVQEIRDRLAKYGYDEVLVGGVVDWLTEKGYLDDVTYVKAFVDERTNRKGYGPMRIARDLRRKGVARETVDAAITDVGRTVVQEVAPVVIKLATRRWARLEREEDLRKRKSKLVQYLQRRGFGYAVSVEILKRVMAESEAY